MKIVVEVSIDSPRPADGWVLHLPDFLRPADFVENLSEHFRGMNLLPCVSCGAWHDVAAMGNKQRCSTCA